MPLKRKTVRDMNFGLIILMFLLALVSTYILVSTSFTSNWGDSILSTYLINKCRMLTLTLILTLTTKKMTSHLFNKWKLVFTLCSWVDFFLRQSWSVWWQYHASNNGVFPSYLIHVVVTDCFRYVDNIPVSFCFIRHDWKITNQ